jgi:hypothetical protein
LKELSLILAFCKTLTNLSRFSSESYCWSISKKHALYIYVLYSRTSSLKSEVNLTYILLYTRKRVKRLFTISSFSKISTLISDFDNLGFYKSWQFWDKREFKCGDLIELTDLKSRSLLRFLTFLSAECLMYSSIYL